jgi:hypothetical protein
MQRFQGDKAYDANSLQKLKGSITPTGLHDLTNIAFEKWKADGVGGPVPVEIVPGSKKMYILNHSQGPGLMNASLSPCCSYDLRLTFFLIGDHQWVVSASTACLRCDWDSGRHNLHEHRVPYCRHKALRRRHIPQTQTDEPKPCHCRGEDNRR